MTTYAIGDLQGCYTEFLQLLEVIDFDHTRDQLWLVGDLVNRGPQSLEVLRYLYAHQDAIQIVLGNHDLHLLAVIAGFDKLRAQDTLIPILNAKDGKDLCRWLQKQPLFHFDATLNFAMVHAGIPPQWSLQEVLEHAQEVQSVLQSPELSQGFLQNMMGNTPLTWQDDLTSWDRLRYITNALTRMRYSDLNGQLDLVSKSILGSQPPDFFPWFALSNRKMADTPIVFGHWASLDCVTNLDNVYAIDSACVWGNKLTALNLETKERISVPSTQPKRR